MCPFFLRESRAKLRRFWFICKGNSAAPHVVAELHPFEEIDVQRTAQTSWSSRTTKLEELNLKAKEQRRTRVAADTVARGSAEVPDRREANQGCDRALQRSGGAACTCWTTTRNSWVKSLGQT